MHEERRVKTHGSERTHQLLLAARRLCSHLLGDLFQDGHLGDSCSRVAEL